MSGLRTRRATRLGSLLAIAGASVAVAACGEDRQDENEPSGSFPVEVSAVAFPTDQRLAQQSTLAITVRNSGDEAIPDLAVTVRGFAKRPEAASRDSGASSAVEPQSDPERPVWVVDTEPPGGETSSTDTWTAGRLEPGRSATLRWRVTPVVAGDHDLRYEIAAGLDGKAKAVVTGGRRPGGSIAVSVDDSPSSARVDPATGDVIRDGE